MMASWWTKAKGMLALLAALQLAASSAQVPPSANNAAEYSRAEALARNRQWDSSLEVVMPLLTNDPRNLKALNLAGIACAGKGDVQRANQYFERAIAVDPHFLPALKNLAINEFNAHEYVSAEKHFLRVQEQIPNDETVDAYLGEIAYRQQKFKLAAERLGRARDLAAHHPDLMAYLAVSLLQSGQKQQAMEVVRGIKPSDIDPQSQVALGVTLAEFDFDAEAIPYLKAAFDRDPDSTDIGFDLALASMEAKDDATAIATGNQMITRGHDASELEDVLAQALEASGETQRALAAFRKAIALDPQDEDNYLDFASMCIDHSEFSDAMTVVDGGLQVHPNSERLTFMRGIVNAMQSRFDLADHDFQQATRLAPEHDLGYVGLGVTYLQRGNSDEAIKIIRDRLRAKPNDASLLYLLGEGLIRAGASPGQPQYIEAQAALEKSVKLNPGLCLPHISLGAIYQDEGRLPQAAAQLEQARAIDPNEKSAYSHLAAVYRRLGEPEKGKETLIALKQLLDQERAGTRVKVQNPSTDSPESGSKQKEP